MATGLVAFFGTVLVSSMACLLATGLASSTTVADRAFLTQFPIILGGWIVAIVLFAMVSTVGVALEGRRGEIAGLRLIGSVPQQIQFLASAETLVVALIAALPGLGLGYLLGAGMLSVVHAQGLTSDSSVYAPGVAVPVIAAGVVLVASVAAAWIGSRRLALRSAVAEPVETERTGKNSRGHTRRVVSAIIIAVGVGSASAVLGLAADDVLTTAMTGPACVLVSVGLCLLAPELLKVVNLALRMFRERPRRAASHLAAINLKVAPDRVRPVVTFLTLFIGVSGGTLAMQGIENTQSVSGSTAQVLASINYLVVILIAAFMAIALTNNLIAAIGRRTDEFHTLSLIGSTTPDIRRMVLQEVGAAVAISAIAGTTGAVLCNIPFSLVKTGTIMAAFAPVPYLLSAVTGTLIALSVANAASSRALRNSQG